MYLQAARASDAAEAVALRQRAAMLLLLAGHVDEGLEVTRGALAVLGLGMPLGPRRALAALLSQRALARLTGLRFRARDPLELATPDWSSGPTRAGPSSPGSARSTPSSRPSSRSARAPDRAEVRRPVPGRAGS